MAMVQLTAALLCFAAVILLQKFVLLSAVPVLLFVCLRTLLPGGVLLLYEMRKQPLRQWLYSIFQPAFLLLSLITTMLPLLLKNYAHQHLSSAKFALLGSTDPFITAVLSWVLFGKVLGVWQIFGIGVAMLGSWVLMWHKIALEAVAAAGVVFGFEMLVFISIILGRIGWMANQYLLTKKNFTVTQTNVLFMLFPGIFSALLCCKDGQFVWMYSNLANWFIWLILGASIGLNTIGCLLMTSSLRKFDATTISVVGTGLIPLVVALGSSVFYAEPLTCYLLLAGSLIFLGVALFNRMHLTLIRKIKDVVSIKFEKIL